MTETPPNGPQSEVPKDPADFLEPIPFMQQILDNPFLLLFLGVTIPTVFYIIWGIIEITSIPIAN